MIVTPIAWTHFDELPDSVMGTQYGRDWLTIPAHDIDLLHEFAGRACYQAWSKPNPSTATNEGYLDNIIRQGHFSVLEHGSVTFYVEGVSRALTHELIRHRHLSYSELSQRYVDVSEVDVVIPPLFRHSDGAQQYIKEVQEVAQDAYEKLVQLASIDLDASRKKAREAARTVLPNIETKIVVTGNLRAWRDMLSKRWHVAADAEIREFAGEILKHLRDIAPNSVQDIPEAPYQ